MPYVTKCRLIFKNVSKTSENDETYVPKVNPFNIHLQDDIKNIRQQFEESIANHEREIKELNTYLEDIRQQKESSIRECNELKTLLIKIHSVFLNMNLKRNPKGKEFFPFYYLRLAFDYMH